MNKIRSADHRNTSDGLSIKHKVKHGSAFMKLVLWSESINEGWCHQTAGRRCELIGWELSKRWNLTWVWIVSFLCDDEQKWFSDRRRNTELISLPLLRCRNAPVSIATALIGVLFYRKCSFNMMVGRRGRGWCPPGEKNRKWDLVLFHIMSFYNMWHLLSLDRRIIRGRTHGSAPRDTLNPTCRVTERRRWQS